MALLADRYSKPMWNYCDIIFNVTQTQELCRLSEGWPFVTARSQTLFQKRLITARQKTTEKWWVWGMQHQSSVTQLWLLTSDDWSVFSLHHLVLVQLTCPGQRLYEKQYQVVTTKLLFDNRTPKKSKLVELYHAVEQWHKCSVPLPAAPSLHQVQ